MQLIELAAPVERAFLVAVDTGADDGWTAEDSPVPTPAPSGR